MAIRHHDWKLVRYDPAVEGNPDKAIGAKLYHLADDLGETNDLAKQHPKQVLRLQALWDQWNARNVPPFWGGGAKKR